MNNNEDPFHTGRIKQVIAAIENDIISIGDVVKRTDLTSDQAYAALYALSLEDISLRPIFYPLHKTSPDYHMLDEDHYYGNLIESQEVAGKPCPVCGELIEYSDLDYAIRFQRLKNDNE